MRGPIAEPKLPHSPHLLSKLPENPRQHPGTAVQQPQPRNGQLPQEIHAVQVLQSLEGQPSVLRAVWGGEGRQEGWGRGRGDLFLLLDGDVPVA